MISYFMPIHASKVRGKQLELETQWTRDRIEENRLINQIRERVGCSPCAQEGLSLSRVLFSALTAALNPKLLAATTVMLLCPNPKRLLLRAAQIPRGSAKAMS